MLVILFKNKRIIHFHKDCEDFGDSDDEEAAPSSPLSPSNDEFISLFFDENLKVEEHILNRFIRYGEITEICNSFINSHFFISFSLQMDSVQQEKLLFGKFNSFYLIFSIIPTKIINLV